MRGSDCSALTGKPKELGQLADQNDQSQPVDVAVAHGLRQKVGEEPHTSQTGDDADQARHHREQPPHRHALRRVDARERHDHRGDQRGDGRVGADHQYPRGTEQRVREQRHHGRVEPVDRGQTRRFGVAHAGRDEQRGEHEAGDHIVASVPQAVGSGRRDSRHPFVDAARGRLVGVLLGGALIRTTVAREGRAEAHGRGYVRRHHETQRAVVWSRRAEAGHSGATPSADAGRCPMTEDRRSRRTQRNRASREYSR